MDDIINKVTKLLTLIDKQAREERDEYWKKQEMGKSSDCYKHCEEARKEERVRTLKWATQLTEAEYKIYGTDKHGISLEQIEDYLNQQQP